MSALELLSSLLQQSLISASQGLQQAAAPWGHPQAMVQARKRVQEQFNGLGAAPSDAGIQAAVQRFVRDGRVDGWLDFKYLCFGLSVPPSAGAKVLMQSPLAVQGVLRGADAYRAEPRRFRRCYQGLLQSYLSAPSQMYHEADAEADEAFRHLRDWLQDRLRLVKQPEGRAPLPGWVQVLIEHRQLLSEQPCRPYLAELRDGRVSGLAAVCDGLGINRQSWLWQEVLLAYVDDLCRKGDTPFRTDMTHALRLAGRQVAELQPSKQVAERMLAALVRRFEGCAQKPEHPGLRDATVEAFGNPWLRREAWDARVRHEPARAMVAQWLKGRLIRDFFELLSQDGAADPRRLNYWLRFEPVIEDMWFVLGEDAQANRTEEFRLLLRRMEGRSRRLSACPQRTNNAFLMRIGPLLVIEFGVTGNACYVFDHQDFHTPLDTDPIPLPRLKQRVSEKRLNHMNQWEQVFDAEVCPRIGFWPKDVPATARWGPSSTLSRQPELAARTAEDLEEILRLCLSKNLKVTDLRARGGNLWIEAPQQTPTSYLARRLSGAGFKYRAGRGYFLSNPD